MRIPIGKKLRFAILKRDAFACRYCGRRAPNVELHIDHVVPVSRGGRNIHTNLVTSCFDCNMGKSADELHGDSARAIEKSPSREKAEALLEEFDEPGLRFVCGWLMGRLAMEEEHWNSFDAIELSDAQERIGAISAMDKEFMGSMRRRDMTIADIRRLPGMSEIYAYALATLGRHVGVSAALDMLKAMPGIERRGDRFFAGNTDVTDRIMTIASSMKCDPTDLTPIGSN